MKKRHTQELSRNKRYFALTSYYNTIGQSNDAFPILGFSSARKRRVYVLIFHPLVGKTNNEHLPKPFFKLIRKSLYLCLLRVSKRWKWGSIPTKKSSRATLMLSFFHLLRTLSGFATGSPIIKTQKGTRPISNHLDRTSLAGKGFIKWAKRELYPAGPTRENISQPCLPRYWGIYWSNSERESYTWSDLTTPDI